MTDFIENDFSAQAKAWVIFCDARDKKILRIFKKGFRHCAVILIQNGYALLIDPLKNRLICDVLKINNEYEFYQQIKAKSRVVVLNRLPKMHAQNAMAVLRPLTCVEIVKHVLGVRQFFIFTPYQLYNALTRIAGEKNDQ